MSEKLIDQALVEQVLKGDKESFDILVRKYQLRLHQSIMRYIPEPNEALDVVQETFIRAYQALASFRGDSEFFTWLYRIGINTAHNVLKSKDHRPPDVDLDIDDPETVIDKDCLEEDQTPEYLLIYSELEKAVLEALEDLPACMKTSIVLREIGGLSYEEIAQILQCPVGTVRSRIARARAAVDNQMKIFKSI